MRRVQSIILIFMAAELMSCMKSYPSTEMYVCVDPSESETFPDKLASILKPMGLTASVGKAVMDRNHVNHVLEARSLVVRVWAENAIIDTPVEKASVYWTHDPNQYFIGVESLPFSRRQASDVFGKIYGALSAHAYRVSHVESSCLNATKGPNG